jgi:Phosphatidylglycerophosphate synthase
MQKEKITFESTLKSSDTEEWIDIYFYRRLGYLWALFFKKTGLSPNGVTILAIFLGVGAGICFYYTDFLTNLLGVGLLIWANTYDSADGQLARMTGKKSEWGRILDGACGDIWFVTIYLALVLRMWPEWSFWILILAVFVGISHGLQAMLADYYRNIHLLFIKGKEGSEVARYKRLKSRYKKMSWSKEPVRKLFEFFYMNYTKAQEKLTPELQNTLKVIKIFKGNRAPEWFCIEFREKSLPLMTYANLLSFNLRAIVLFISVLINLPWIYFVFELTVMNLMLFYMRYRHERFSKKFRSQLMQKH